MEKCLFNVSSFSYGHSSGSSSCNRYALPLIGFASIWWWCGLVSGREWRNADEIKINPCMNRQCSHWIFRVKKRIAQNTVPRKWRFDILLISSRTYNTHNRIEDEEKKEFISRWGRTLTTGGTLLCYFVFLHSFFLWTLKTVEIVYARRNTAHISLFILICIFKTQAHTNTLKERNGNGQGVYGALLSVTCFLYLFFFSVKTTKWKKGFGKY